MNTQIKQIVKIQDDTFEIDHLHEYILSIQTTNTHFRFCVIDTLKNKCVSLEDYHLITNPESTSQYLKALNQLFENHSYLQAGFWKSVKISVKNNNFTLVPAPFFAETDVAYFTKDFFNINKDTVWLNYKYNKDEIVCLFAANQPIIDWVKSKYPKKQIDVLHNALANMEASSWASTKDAKVSTKVYADVDHGLTNITLRRNGKLEMCNQFEFKSPNDFLYYILLIYSEFDLDPENVHLVLSGEITKASESYFRVYKYIRHVDFAAKPHLLKLGYKFDELPEHFYQDLFTLHAC